MNTERLRHFEMHHKFHGANAPLPKKHFKNQSFSNFFIPGTSVLIILVHRTLSQKNF